MSCILRMHVSYTLKMCAKIALMVVCCMSRDVTELKILAHQGQHTSTVAAN